MQESPNNPSSDASLAPTVHPDSPIAKTLRQIFIICMVLGIFLVVFFGFIILIWANMDNMIELASNQETTTAADLEKLTQAREQLNQIPEGARQGVTIGFLIFGIVPGFLYLIFGTQIKKFSTVAIMTLLVVSVMQSFVSGMLLLSGLSGGASNPCQLMMVIILFGSMFGTVASLAWKLYQVRQYQMRHLIQLQKGITAQMKQAQASQIQHMDQNQQNEQKQQLQIDRPVEPWDE